VDRRTGGGMRGRFRDRGGLFSYISPATRVPKDHVGCRLTVGEDKAYDTADHVAALREMRVTPHVAQNDSETKTGKRRRSAIDTRTTRHRGYRLSQAPCARAGIVGYAVSLPTSCAISSPTTSWPGCYAVLVGCRRQ
jgi:hypothetical protein